MGAKCCTDRKEARPGRQELALAGAPKPERRPSEASNAYDPRIDLKSRAVPSGYKSAGDDATAFDKAFETNDLQALVRLLPSRQGVEAFEERMHPWAEDPKTVGALAATQLAILASEAERDNPNVKVEIAEAGAIPRLVDFLRTHEVDRVQAAVVALSFLTSECSSSSVAAYQAGALPLVLHHMESSIGGMRVAAATTLRNMCMEKEEYRKEFVGYGGLQALVRHLSQPLDTSLADHADVQLEAVLNLQDVLEYHDGSGVIPEYAREVIEAGAEETLKAMLLAEDRELRGAAEEILTALDVVKKGAVQAGGAQAGA